MKRGDIVKGIAAALAVANYKQAVSSVFDLALNRDQRNDKLRQLNLKVKR